MCFVSLWYVCLFVYISLHVRLSELLLGLHVQYVCIWSSCCWEFSTLRLIVYFVCVSEPQMC